MPPSAPIEFTPAGQFIGQFSLDPVAGAAFGLAITFDDGRLTLATVKTFHLILPRAAFPSQ